MDLVEFLTARLDEDEQVARAAIAPGPTGSWVVHVGRAIGVVCTAESGQRVASVSRAPQSEHIARHDPARVLADVEAKRRLLAVLDGDPFDALGAEGAYKLLVAKHLAAPYADHPDYRPEWAPDTADA